MNDYNLIPEQLMVELKSLLQLYKNYSNNWNKIKNVIVFSIPWQMRKLFSTRENATNKKHPNALEYQIMQWWADNTQQKIIFTDGDEVGEIKPNSAK